MLQNGTNINGVMYLLKKANTYKDVEHILKMANIQSAEDTGATAIENDEPVDIIEIDLKECFDALGEIIGATYSEEIIDNLFENFCVGK